MLEADLSIHMSNAQLLPLGRSIPSIDIQNCLELYNCLQKQVCVNDKGDLQGLGSIRSEGLDEKIAYI